MGSVFDMKDIGCYGMGCVILGTIEFVKNKKIV